MNLYMYNKVPLLRLCSQLRPPLFGPKQLVYCLAIKNQLAIQTTRHHHQQQQQQYINHYHLKIIITNIIKPLSASIFHNHQQQQQK